MAQLFGVQVPAISKHLKDIYAEGELLESTTISKMETVVQRGFRGGVEEMVDFYNRGMLEKRAQVKSVPFMFLHYN